MLTEILLGLVALAALSFFAWSSTYWTKRGVKQRWQVPFLGENWRTVLRLECFADMIQRIYRQFPNERYSGIFQFGKPILLIRDPEIIKRVLVKDFDHFVDHRSLVPDNVDPIWSRNLFSLTGQKWRDLRPVLSPSFTSRKLKNMFFLMSDIADSWVDFYLKTDRDPIEIELRDAFTRYATDIIATTAFGIETDSLKEPQNDIYLLGQQASVFNGLKFLIYFFVPTSLIRLFDVTVVSKKVKAFLLGMVEETIRIREEQNIVRPDMIHLLMQAKKGTLKYEEDTETLDGFSVVEESEIGKQIGKKTEITNMDIASQAFVFFLGGFETTASLMCFVGYELAVNPDVQDKLREEVRATLGECDDGVVTYDALLRMKYLDMVFSETLRKWTPGFFADRVCTKPYTIEPELPGEVPVHISKGDVIWVPTKGIHMDDQYFPNPEKFDPERFSDENKESINPYAYLPFGLGPRNCIGSRFALLEAKIVFFHLLSRFEIVPVGRSQIPIRLSAGSVNLLPKDGFWFGLGKLGQK